MNQNTDPNVLSVRLTALGEAVRLAGSIGLACPACIIELAHDFEAYLLNGTVPAKHLSENEPDPVPPEGDEVVPFDPSKKLN